MNKGLQAAFGRDFDRALEELRSKLRQRAELNEDQFAEMLVAYSVAYYESFFQKPVEPFLQQLRPSQVN